jgi:uncharacterized membrane protein
MHRDLVGSPSLALAPYDGGRGVDSRGGGLRSRVHLEDLSGVLALAVLAGLWWSLQAMRRRELSLAQFTHALVMAFLVLVGGHFVEEHVVGPDKAEALLRYGFAAFGKTTRRRSASQTAAAAKKCSHLVERSVLLWPRPLRRSDLRR